MYRVNDSATTLKPASYSSDMTGHWQGASDSLLRHIDSGSSGSLLHPKGPLMNWEFTASGYLVFLQNIAT